MRRVTQKMGYVSPLGEKSVFTNKQDLKEKGYYEGKINFQFLIGYLKNNQRFQFYHEKFISNQRKVVTNLSPFATSVDTHVLFLATWETGEQYEMKMEGKLNKRIDRIVLRQSKIHLSFQFTKKKETEYTVAIKYEFFDENAIELKVYTYEDLEFLMKYLELRIPEYLRKQISSKFNLAFEDAQSDCNVIDNLYEFAPDFVIFNRKSEYVWNDLVSLSKCQINEESIFFSGSNENIAVLNILSNFPNKLYLFIALQKNPKFISSLFDKIDPDYREDFLIVVSTICIQVWDQSSIDGALDYIYEPINSYSYVNEVKVLDQSITSSCTEFTPEQETGDIKNIKNKKYGLADMYNLYTGVPRQWDITIAFTRGFVNPLDPLRTEIDGETYYIPGILAAHLTDKKNSALLKTVFFNILDGYISAPTSVVKAASAAAKVSKEVAKKSLKYRIRTRYRAAVRNFKRKSKSNIRKLTSKRAERHLEDFVKLRGKYGTLEKVQKLWNQKITQKLLFPNNLKKLYSKYLKGFPELENGFNQAEFITKIYNKKKRVETVIEFSISGNKKKLINEFGDPPKLPPNTINILDDYNSFAKFSQNAVDYVGRIRSFDSELKYIFNFLKNHINKGDEFVIETKNIFATCSSCKREFLMLEEYMTSIGKKVKFIVFSDETIKSTKFLKKKLKVK